MKLVELYYKAFQMFRKHTKDDEDSMKLRTAISHSNHLEERFETIKYVCKIDLDWVVNIEEGLDFVRKAINEDRQFIRSEGEVVPIEKVKKVTRASVEHLTRHSNYITRLPEDEKMGIIPEKLYIVEKLSDFQVYENRFLFMLLRYVKDFVELRLNKMKDKTATYQSIIMMDKNIEDRNRTIQYKLDYQDMIKNDPYLIKQFHQIPLANRVENIYAIAVSLLATPLMREVSKAPMIKPPVIKTNVLRMNQNFKAALKLYDYITSYSKDGFEIVESRKTYQPFDVEMSDEVAETIELTSVIGYITGNKIKHNLQEQLDSEEQQLQQELDEQKVAEIKRLKRRLVELDEDPIEYMHTLEKRNAELEKNNASMFLIQEKNLELRKQNEELKSEHDALSDTIHELNDLVKAKEMEMDKMNQTYYKDLQRSETIHQQEMADFDQKNKEDISAIRQKYREEQSMMQSTFNTEREKWHQNQQQERQQVIDKYETRIANKNTEITELEDQITSLQNHITKNKETIHVLNKDIAKVEDEMNFAYAQHMALRIEQGLIGEDEEFTSKEQFLQLEKERKAYNKLFKDQWKKAKRQLRERLKAEANEQYQQELQEKKQKKEAKKNKQEKEE